MRHVVLTTCGPNRESTAEAPPDGQRFSVRVGGAPIFYNCLRPSTDARWACANRWRRDSRRQARSLSSDWLFASYDNPTLHLVLEVPKCGDRDRQWVRRTPRRRRRGTVVAASRHRSLRPEFGAQAPRSGSDRRSVVEPRSRFPDHLRLGRCISTHPTDLRYLRYIAATMRRLAKHLACRRLALVTGPHVRFR